MTLGGTHTSEERGVTQPKKKPAPLSRAERARRLREERKTVRETHKEYTELVAYYRKLDAVDTINDAAFGPDIRNANV